MCLNHISIFCRHSSYCITYTVASFVNMFSLTITSKNWGKSTADLRAESDQGSLRLWLSKSSNQDGWWTTHRANGKPNPKNFCSATSFWSCTRFTFQSRCCSDVTGVGRGEGEGLRNRRWTQQKSPKVKPSKKASVRGAGAGRGGHCTLWLPATALRQKMLGGFRSGEEQRREYLWTRTG